MMMMAGAALSALDLLSGLMNAGSTTQSKSASSASPFSLAGASANSAANASASTEAGSTSSIPSSVFSSETLQALLDLQSEQAATTSSPKTDLLSMLDDEDTSTSGSKNSSQQNAVLQEMLKRIQETQAISPPSVGTSIAMNV